MGKGRRGQIGHYSRDVKNTPKQTIPVITGTPSKSNLKKPKKSDSSLRQNNRGISSYLSKPNVRRTHGSDLIKKTKKGSETSINELVEQVRDMSIQEEKEEDIKEFPMIDYEEYISSPISPLDYNEKSPDSPCLTRKGSFELSMKKSPIVTFSDIDYEDDEINHSVEHLDLNDNIGLDIDMCSSRSPSIPPEEMTELTDIDKESIVQDLLSLVFFRDNYYTAQGYQPLPIGKKEEIFMIIMNSVFIEEHTSDDMDLQGEEYLVCFFTQKVVLYILKEMKYERPYGMSGRYLLLENICHMSRELYLTISQCLYISLTDYLLLERGTPYTEPDEQPSAAITILTGHPHRYISLFEALVQLLREFLQYDDPTVVSKTYNYYSQYTYIHLSSLIILLKTRSALTKYTALLSSSSIILFSVNKAILPRLFEGIIKVWPKGYSDKEFSLLEYLEQVLSSLPPIYLLKDYKICIYNILKRICQCIHSFQAKIASRAITLLNNYYICTNCIYTDNDICELVKNTFNEGMNYWNPIVAEACETAFDKMLDMV
ncbi:hypothetical protein WA158_002461 [Blastocystis sp. Blastoise]